MKAQVSNHSSGELRHFAGAIDDELRKIEPVGLEAAMKTDLLSRIDTKVALSPSELLHLVRTLAKCRPNPYRLVVTPTGFAPRYSTLYFDTSDLRHYRAHHDGRRIRQKFRYRRYESTNSTFFEIKRRTNGRTTTKTRVAVDRPRQQIGETEASLVESMGLDVDGLEPTLNVTYHRTTLLGHHQRVTVDVALECESRTGRSAEFTRTAIVEIKDQYRRPDSPISLALRELGLRPHPISKYCVGVASCFSDAKRNNFRPTLRRIEACK